MAKCTLDGPAGLALASISSNSLGLKEILKALCKRPDFKQSRIVALIICMIVELKHSKDLLNVYEDQIIRFSPGWIYSKIYKPSSSSRISNGKGFDTAKLLPVLT